MSLIYKLLTAAEWEAAKAAGRFDGSAVDHADGYIHFSGPDQVAETARRYFRHVPDLMLLAVETEDLGEALKWEPSRGGDLFPHLFAPLPVSAVRRATGVGLDGDGVPIIGDLPA